MSTIEMNMNPIEDNDIHIFIKDGDIISTPFTEMYYIIQALEIGKILFFLQ